LNHRLLIPIDLISKKKPPRKNLTLQKVELKNSQLPEIMLKVSSQELMLNSSRPSLLQQK
jgi:hypothetical protein